MEWTWPILPVRANLWRRLHNVFIIKTVTNHAINIHLAPSAPFSWCSIVASGHPEIRRLNIKSKVGVPRRPYHPITQDRLQLHLRERFCDPREGSCAFLDTAFSGLGEKSQVSAHSTVESGVPPYKSQSVKLVMPAQPASGECRYKYK